MCLPSCGGLEDENALATFEDGPTNLMRVFSAFRAGLLA